MPVLHRARTSLGLKGSLIYPAASRLPKFTALLVFRALNFDANETTREAASAASLCLQRRNAVASAHRWIVNQNPTKRSPARPWAAMRSVLPDVPQCVVGTTGEHLQTTV
jgi:hypothetical protein